jgi:hypothetical protein
MSVQVEGKRKTEGEIVIRTSRSSRLSIFWKLKVNEVNRTARCAR